MGRGMPPTSIEDVNLAMKVHRALESLADPSGNAVYDLWRSDPDLLAECLRSAKVSMILGELNLISQLPVPWTHPADDLVPFLIHRVTHLRNEQGDRIASLDSWQDMDPVGLGLALQEGTICQVALATQIDTAPPVAVSKQARRCGPVTRRAKQVSDLAQRAERVLELRQEDDRLQGDGPKYISYPTTPDALLEFLVQLVAGLKTPDGRPVRALDEWRSAHPGSYSKATRNNLTGQVIDALALETKRAPKGVKSHNRQIIV